MKLAITVQGNDLQSPVDPRLGRCQQFLLVNSDTLEYEVLQNPNVGAAGGAGIQTAQLLASQGVEVVITGNCGPNAFATLQAAGIPVYIGASGTVQQAIDLYQQGKLQSAAAPNVGGHFGDPRMAGGGMGGGRGGMGGGRRGGV